MFHTEARNQWQQQQENFAWISRKWDDSASKFSSFVRSFIADVDRSLLFFSDEKFIVFNFFYFAWENLLRINESETFPDHEKLCKSLKSIARRTLSDGEDFIRNREKINEKRMSMEATQRPDNYLLIRLRHPFYSGLWPRLSALLLSPETAKLSSTGFNKVKQYIECEIMELVNSFHL